MHFQKVYTQKQVKAYFKPSVLSQVREFFLYLLKVFLIISFIYLLIRFNLFDRVDISGKSMYPTYNEADNPSKEIGKNDTILIDILTPKFGSYQRGDVVVMRSPTFDKTGELYIKRVIALPEETVIFDNGKVFVQNIDNPKSTRLDEASYLKGEVATYKGIERGKIVENKLQRDEYYLMGDNRGGSSDSRVFGAVKKTQILGKEFYRMTPSVKSGWFNLPKYNIGNTNQ